MTEIRRWQHRRAPGEPVSAETRDSYYSLPVIHGPHWRWPIVFYFVLGGLAGGSAVLAAAGRLVGGHWARPIVRAGRYLAFLAVLPGPLLLIIDLGRPERFHHMLRVVKLRSPMSLGVWGLIGFTATAF
ncbi:MAG: NrfD/PsrC family molybdoenzyme membrane anchor subunit, partial [Thermomicrobium sp.]